MTAYNDIPRDLRDRWNAALPTIGGKPFDPAVAFLFELLGVDMKAIRSERALQVAALIEALRWPSVPTPNPSKHPSASWLNRFSQ